METYCVICKKNTENKNCCVKSTKQNRIMLVSKFFASSKTKLRFIKNQEVP